MPLLAVTFDAAGTLFAPREPVGVTYARIAAAYGITLEPAATNPRFRNAVRAAPPLAFPGVPREQRAAAERAWWRDVVHATFDTDAAAHPRFDACFDTLFEHYARPEAWKLDDGALDTLRALRAGRLRLAVLSNFDSRLGALLAGLGITPLVDAVVASADHHAAKPDPRLFHAAARLLGAPPNEILHVGDDPDLDVGGARAAGFRVLLFAPGGGSTPPGIPVLRRLRDLPAAL
jgi:putative hydrolase of the HAD superfamily